MIEKTVLLEDISLVDFLGVQNKNINALAQAFPSSKIISRGNTLKLIGKSSDVNELNEFIEALLEHYHKYGKINSETIEEFLHNRDSSIGSSDIPGGPILYGPKGLVIKPKSANQQNLVESIRKNDLTFAIGPAGSGKTYIAVAMAVQALKNKEIKRLIITRPAVEAGENLGFLPGDLEEKVDPYLRPIYDALEDFLPIEKLNYYKETGVIEIAPLAFMRGRTLNNAFVLLDEAQNTTPMQIKMCMTRLGPQGKMIITGDISQTDLPRSQKSGLKDAVEKLTGVDGIGIVALKGKDVVRHPLVKKIIDAYDQRD